MDKQSRNTILLSIGLAPLTLLIALGAIYVKNEIVIGCVALLFMGTMLAVIFATMKQQVIRGMYHTPPKVALDESGVEELEWAGANGFPPIGKFVAEIDNSSAPLAPAEVSLEIWKNADGTCLVRTRANKLEVLYFETVLAGERKVCVRTSSNQITHNFPSAPGVFVEIFHKESLGELYIQHRDSVGFVRRRFGLQAVEPVGDVPRRVKDTSRDDALFVMSIPKWPVKAILWELRSKKYNKVPIADRYGDLTPSDLWQQMDDWETQKLGLISRLENSASSGG
ncbi:MAG: hypothetical protein Phyf2KO_13290 [Phycisphaerales bacterium]